jgi:hypothetical protein
VAKENRIFLLILLFHTSRKLQPLDCTVFAPDKTYNNTCLNDWILPNPHKPVTIYGVEDITGKTFSKEFAKQY